MATLNAAQTATVNITTPGAFLTVDCSSGAVVRVSWAGPGSVTGIRTVRNISEDLGPFSDNTVITLSCESGTATYTEIGSQIPPLVSVAGNLAYAAVATTTGTPGEMRKLSDGPDAGAVLVWSIPEGSTSYAWCWQIYPLAAYL